VFFQVIFLDGDFRGGDFRGGDFQVVYFQAAYFSKNFTLLFDSVIIFSAKMSFRSVPPKKSELFSHLRDGV
jgi:hypothetical protein